MYYRSVSKWYIVISVLYILVGVIMLVWPKITMDMVGIVLGVALLAYGVARVIIYFTKSHMEGIVHMDLTTGVVFGSLGGFMLLHRDFVTSVIPFAVAIVLMIGAISKLEYSLDMKRLGANNYKIFLIFSIIIFALGVILIINPFEGNTLIWFIGGCVIVEGLMNCIIILFFSRLLRKTGKGSFDVTEHMNTPYDRIENSRTSRRPEETLEMKSDPKAQEIIDVDENSGKSRKKHDK